MRYLRFFLLLSLCALQVSGRSAVGAEVSGKQTEVFSPAFIEVGSTRVRLEGLRAPRNDQICNEGSVPWTCGRDARWAVLNRLGNHWIVCLDRGRAADGSFIGLCYLGGVGGPELNSWLVEQGWALTDATGAERYLEEETTARAERRGLWRNGVEPIWE